MRNKHFLLPVLAIAFTACQTDEIIETVVTDADEANFTITLSAPEAIAATRAADGSNSACGGLTNVDMSEYDLRYQLAVYRQTTDDDGDTAYVLAINPQVQVVPEYQTVAYQLRLTPNRTYRFVAWADFVKAGTSADLHYNTEVDEDTGKWIITCKDKADAQLNDESRDAYFVSAGDYTIDGDCYGTFELTRPFAKVRLIATDWDYENLEMPDNFKVTYYGCSRFKNINLCTGVSKSDKLGSIASSSTDSTDEDTTDDTTTDDSTSTDDTSTETTVDPTTYTTTIVKTAKDYAGGYDGSDYEITTGTGATYSYRTLTVDYLMTDITEQTEIHFTFEALDGTTAISSYDFETDIPIKRNYLTTIMGNVLTTAAAISVYIDEDFTDEYTIPDGNVATAAELQLALDLGVDKITLTDDITVDGALSIFSTTSTINLNGYTLTTSKGIYYFTDDTYEGTTKSGSTLTINGTSTTTSAGLATRDNDESSLGKLVDSYGGVFLCGSGAGLVLNNVEMSSKYMAVCMGADPYDDKYDVVDEYQTLTVNNSTITTNISGTAAVGIQAHNCTVTMENSTINAAGSGISNAYYKYLAPQGCEITLTSTSITTGTSGRCVYLMSVEDADPCELTITGGTYTSGCYNNIDLPGSDVTITGATIINTYKNTSTWSNYYSSNGSTGAGIALQSPYSYNKSYGYYTNDIANQAFSSTVSLTSVTYKLAEEEGHVYWVGIWDTGYKDYTSSDTVNGVERRWYGSDGHTEDSEYEYTETSEEE